MSKRDASLIDSALPVVTEAVPRHKPCVAGIFGRGNVGKSVLGLLLAERALAAARNVIVADIDRTNATLPAFLDGVARPEYAEDEAVSEWLSAMIEDALSTRRSILLDTAGGDDLFLRYAKQFGLGDLLTSQGVEPVAIHVIGPSVDDLSMLRDFEEAGVFAPERTILVLNEGRISDGRPAALAFRTIEEHPVFRAALNRGAVLVRMPKLPCMAKLLNARLTFTQAVSGVVVDGRETFGLMNRQLVKGWRAQMDEQLLPVERWLP